jgi:hypothetical protein
VSVSLCPAAAPIEAARRGWAIFPAHPGGKRPAICRWEQRASADPDHVAAAWRGQFSGFNYGIACGPSGLVVLDLDVAVGKPDGRVVFLRLCRREGVDQPPQTFMVSTPRGGVHLYFSAPELSEIRNSAGRVGVCIDVRGRGGYVIGPGSVVGERVYEVATNMAVAPLPGWLAGLAEPSVMPPTPALHAPPPPSTLSRHGGGVGLVLFVANLAVGERNNGLFWAASRAAEIGRADVLAALVFAATATGLPEDEAWRTVRSALDRRSS